LGFSTLDIYKGRFGESDSEGDELDEIKFKASLATSDRPRNFGLKAFSTTDVRGGAFGSSNRKMHSTTSPDYCSGLAADGNSIGDDNF